MNVSHVSEWLRERICSGPKDGPYRATMKFSEVQRMLLDGFGDTITPRDVKKALDIGHYFASCMREHAVRLLYTAFCTALTDVHSHSHSLASSITFKLTATRNDYDRATHLLLLLFNLRTGRVARLLSRN